MRKKSWKAWTPPPPQKKKIRALRELVLDVVVTKQSDFDRITSTALLKWLKATPSSNEAMKPMIRNIILFQDKKLKPIKNEVLRQ